MENAAKALAIAAAVIFTLLVLTLLVILYNQLSSYFQEKNKMTEIEQLQEFNARFANYEGKEIRGNELVSIMNRIIDYNNLQSDMQGYERIIINVNLKGHASQLTFDGNTQVGVFNSGNISNNTSDEQIKNLAEVTINAQREISGLTHTKLDKIYHKPDNKADILSGISGNENKIDNYIKIYHIFSELKKVYFECTSVTYDPDTGRVNGMMFEVFEVVEVDSDGNETRRLKME